MKKFTDETMLEIVSWMEKRVSGASANEIITFQIVDPDTFTGAYSGNRKSLSGVTHIYHSWKSWYDLAGLLYCRILTPHIVDDDMVELRFMKLDRSSSFHHSDYDDKNEKYGETSSFSKIVKNEESSFLHTYRHALRQVRLEKRTNILDLGINSGDEFELIRSITEKKIYKKMRLIGIDHSQSAIKKAKEKFSEDANCDFFCHDINCLDELALPKSDLIISIGTLQSPGINFKLLLMSLVQNHLTADGAMMLGFPNCRWIDGEMVYGATAPNYNFPEMSLVIKDIYFCKKYLQQHRFRVSISGKDYLFLSATKIGK